MPDFTVSVSGATVEQWLDPAITGAPSRLNPREGRAMRRLVGTVGSPVTLTATAAGLFGPLDTALGGRLFECIVAESPVVYGIPFTIPTAGRSSVQRFTPPAAGHYLVYMRRPGGGSWFLHVDAVAP